MDELMDLLVKDDASASQISDKIKDILFQKSAENIETVRPNIAASIFDDSISKEVEDNTPDEEYEEDEDEEDAEEEE
ncbi:MAG: hypothetical protein ACTSWQ_06070 [Candidatus Thorarchaeota archaeon]